MIALIEAKAKRDEEKRNRSENCTFEIARLVLLEHCTFVDAGARFGISSTSARERLHRYCGRSNPKLWRAMSREYGPNCGGGPALVEDLRRNGKQFFKRAALVAKNREMGGH
jgi:hypothetical protein